MQAALITNMPAATSSIEPSAETGSSGQGLRISSTLQPQKPDSLFTTILRQGIAVKMPPSEESNAGAHDIRLLAASDGVKNTDGDDEPVDVGSLLIQLMVMNASAQMQSDGSVDSGSGEAKSEALKVISAVINENPELSGTIIKGLEDSTAVILQNGGKTPDAIVASEVFKALAAAENAVGNSELTKGADFEQRVKAALAGITEALKTGLEQNAGVSGSQTATNTGVISGDGLLVNEIEPGKTEKLQAAAIGSDTAKTSGQTENTLAVGTGTVVPGAGKEPNSGEERGGGSLSDKAESIFGGVESRGKNRNDDTGVATDTIGQMLNGSGFKGETIAEKTSAVERALNRFADDLRSFTSGTQEIKIVLEPESLGVLIISVIKTENGISAKIKSEDKEVAAIITDHLQKLISSMQNKGITVDDVDVVYSQTEQNNSFTQHGFSQARDEASGGYYRPDGKNSDDAAGADLWQNFYSGDTGGDTTVDYRV